MEFVTLVAIVAAIDAAVVVVAPNHTMGQMDTCHLRDNTHSINYHQFDYTFVIEWLGKSFAECDAANIDRHR